MDNTIYKIRNIRNIHNFISGNYDESNNENIEYIENSINDILNDPLLKSVRLNYIFYITTTICLFLISYSNGSSFVWAIISMTFISFLGYLCHYISHSIYITDLYNEFHDNSNNNYLTRNRYADYFIRLICKMLDFHETTHHDSSINKSVENISIEFVMNFYVQSGAFLMFMYFIKNLSYDVVLLWGLLYPTVHLINYDIIKCKTHMQHHVDKKTNYGIDIWDILFNTKYDGDNNDIENINHYSINMVILTAMLIFFILNRRTLINI